MRLEKNKDKAVKSGGGKLDLSSEVQTLLRGLAQSGIRKDRPL
jgi:hypothetical protein